MRRVISLILSIAMVASLATGLAVTSFAETQGDYEYEINGETAKITGRSHYYADFNIPAIIGGKPVTSIGEEVFSNINGIDNVVIPASVTNISSRAFNTAEVVQTVTVEAVVPPTLGENVFYGIGTLYVPEGSVGAYQASSWTDYTWDIREMPKPIKINGEAAQSCPEYYASGTDTIVINNDVTFTSIYKKRGNLNIIIPKGKTLTISETDDENYWSILVACEGNITITGGGTLNIIRYGLNSCCIVSSNAEWDYYRNDEQLYPSVTKIGTGNITISGCTVSATNIDGNGGIQANGNITITDSIVTASTNDIGIYGASGISIDNNSTVKSKGINPFVTQDSEGIRVNGTIISTTNVNNYFEGTDVTYNVVNIRYYEPQPTDYTLYVVSGTDWVCCNAGPGLLPVADASKITYEITSDNPKEVMVTGYDGDMPEGCSLTIPKTVKISGEDYTVTSIDESAFEECTELASIGIPNSVISIGESAFMNCTGLTSIMIPDSVKIIGDFAFTASGLTTITIPKSVKAIGYRALFCTGLESINVDEENEDYTSIDGILYSKDEKELICYPAVKKGTSFDIPNSVITISDYAFCACSALTDVTIGDGITSIGKSAFLACAGLTSVTVKAATPPTLGKDAFKNCSLTTIYVPAGKVGDYKAAAGWSAYDGIITAMNAEPSGSITINGDPIETTITNYGGNIISQDKNTITVDKISTNEDVEINIPSGKKLFVSSTGSCIYIYGILKITGGGELECINEVPKYSAIHGNKGVIIDGCTVSATSLECSVIKSESGYISITDSVIYACGEGSNGLAISAEGSVLVSNSYILAFAKGDESNSINVGDSIFISNSSTIYASATMFGLMASSEINISKDSKVIIDVDANAYALVAPRLIIDGDIPDETFFSGTDISINSSLTLTIDDEEETYNLLNIRSSSPVEIIFPARLSFNGDILTVKGADTYDYNATAEGEDPLSGNDVNSSLSLTKGYFYIITASDKTFYVNYVVKEITIQANPDELIADLNQANTLISKVATNTNKYLPTTEPDGKVYTTVEAYNTFSQAITDAEEVKNNSSHTQLEIDGALVDLNGALRTFISTLRADTWYINNGEVTHTNLNFEGFTEGNYTVLQKVGTATQDRVQSTLSVTVGDYTYSTTYKLYANVDDENAYSDYEKSQQTPHSPTDNPPIDPQPTEPKPVVLPITVTDNGNGTFTITKVLDFNVRGIYYGLGTELSDADYFGLVKDATSCAILGNGTHTFKVLATYNGETKLYKFTVDVDYTDPVAVNQNGVVFINFNGTTPSKISYVKGQDTIYIPIEDKIKLDATEFYGVGTIKFDETDVTIN